MACRVVGSEEKAFQARDDSMRKILKSWEGCHKVVVRYGLEQGAYWRQV